MTRCLRTWNPRKHQTRLQLMGPLGAAIVVLALGCGGWRADGANEPIHTETYDDVTITTPTTWINQFVTITGTLTIVTGATLTLDRTTILFSPAVEDTDSFAIEGGSLIARNGSMLRTASGKQWNLQAHGACTVRFHGSQATNHSGLRMFDACAFSADHSDVEEVQIHDNATLDITNNSQVYPVLFFAGSGASTTLVKGELGTGPGVTRSFTFPTGAGTTGRVRISHSTVTGYQLDLLGDVAVTVSGATNVVLALHLRNVGNPATPVLYRAPITSDHIASGAVDFSAQGNPKFLFTNSRISSFNVYLTGMSNVSFAGPLTVNEPDAADGSILTFGPGVSVYANLAMAHDAAHMIFNGSTLLDGDASFPSFTAEGESLIRLNGVRALPDVRVYAVGEGQVHIIGGSGWSPAMFQVIDPQPPGGIFVRSP